MDRDPKDEWSIVLDKYSKANWEMMFTKISMLLTVP
jgi:hypothetical protein